MTAVAESLRLSNSKVKTWRRCPRRYRFKYVEKLKPRRRKPAPELGSWVHDLLMHLYDGENWLARHQELRRDFMNLFEEEREELGDVPGDALRLMRSYLRTYPDDLKRYRVIDSEVDELIALPGGDSFNFIIDLVLEEVDGGGLWLMDHKSSKKFIPSDFMLLDAQLTRYYWGAAKLGYTPLLGVIFNEILTKAPTVPEVLQSGRLTQKQNQHTDVATYMWAIKHLDEVDQDPQFYLPTLRRIKAQEHERFFRRTFIPKDPPVIRTMMRELLMTSNEIKRATRKDEFPRSPDKACTWDCDYLEPCTIELLGGDISDTVKLKYTITRREED